MNKLVFTGALSLASFTADIHALELSKHLTTSTDPIPKVRVSPKYPINAARNSREGWARFSFIIEKDGSVSNILTMETSGSRDLTVAAKKAIMKWQYEPAFENGEAIQRCANSIQMDFSMGGKGEQKVSRRFLSLYKKAKSALDNNDYNELEILLSKFSKFKNLHLSENNYLQLLKADYAKKQGNKFEQSLHLRNVRFQDSKTKNQQKLFVLNQRLYLETELNQFKSAYNIYEQLKKLDEAQPYMENYTAVIQSIDNLIKSKENIVVNADIKTQDYWHHSLMRNQFTLANIKGEVNKIDIRCANKRHEYSFKQNNTWKIPASWEKCNVFVFANDNTTFDIVELSKES